jgi:gliding motility-associated-like protein
LASSGRQPASITPGMLTITRTGDNGICQISNSRTVPAGESKEQYPNVFTPDGDEVNDIFLPIFDCTTPQNYHLKIYNRWGQLIFETTNPKEGWNGNIDSTPAPVDVYGWHLSYIQNGSVGVNRKGEVNLLR